jgi:translation initiation factor 3 subunit E
MNDFFLVSCRNEFMENARLLIFETYCRIHQTIDISTLAQKLDMDQDAAERWIVNLIRNAHLDAKIDSAANHVIMGTQNPGMYASSLSRMRLVTAGLVLTKTLCFALGTTVTSRSSTRRRVCRSARTSSPTTSTNTSYVLIVHTQ